MKTLAGRTPRVLLVAAMSTTALVGASATAGAAEFSDPASPDCHDPGAVPSAIPVLAVNRSACDSAASKVRTILVNAMRSDDSLRVAEPSVLKVFDLLHPESRECGIPSAAVVGDADPAEAVKGTDLTAVVGTPAENVLPMEVPAPEVLMTFDGMPDSAAAETAAETGVASTTEGVVVEDTIVEERAVAPEQMEVVGPQTAATGALPATGSDSAVLAMLGFAMVGSGASARYVARD